MEDTGPGLAPEVCERVFEPYVRGPAAHTPGIGLGLATVKRIVEANEGQVGVHSRPGGGCAFWLELPRVARPPSLTPTERPQAQGGGSGP